jgi:DNA-binding transcriptional ArsR family regulator/uncharacterized protein YndB with AHSA1/START domain
MDGAFRALADPTRRRLLDTLHDRNGQTLAELCVGMHQTRQSVSKHLAILEEAGLVTTDRQGRNKLHYLNPAPINDIGERWIHRYERARIDALADLKRALEDHPMETTDLTEFRYTTYIRTTPERLWQVLTDPAFTKVWWQATAIDSTWATGAPMTWHHRQVTMAHPEQVVLEADPPRRLSFTWHTFTPEWGEMIGLDPDVRAAIADEPRSAATFDLEPHGELVKLTVTHANLVADGQIIQLISQGWPRVLSDLKSLVETGEVAPG